MKFQELGTVSITPQQHQLIDRCAELILEGTFLQAVQAFEVIFEREPENDFEMEVFRLLCEQKIKERDGDYGIKGTFKGGRTN